MDYKRILIFNVNWIGDVLFSTAVIRNIRRNFKGSFIACVIPSRCYPVLKNNPHLDEVIIFDEKDRHKPALEKLKFISYIRGKNFDSVFLLHRSFTRALICRLAGIPERIGYATKKRKFLLTKKIPPVDIHSMHRIDYYLNIVERAGLRCEDRYGEFFTSQQDDQAVEKFLGKEEVKSRDLLIGINAGGNWLPKRWPKEYWPVLADKLIEGLGARVIIAGGSLDLALAKEIKGAMKNRPLIGCGVFNLNQSASLFKRLSLFISADTGPLHIANAAGAKKIIALFGPTSPKITGPYPLSNAVILHKDTGCKLPCYTAGCKDNRCMKAITPDEVFKQAKLLLGK